jgi:ribosomal protein S18 acetylase RimI-like enzyme
MTQSQPSLISTLNDTQIDQLVALYSEEFWCNKRTRPGVERMLSHSDVVLSAVDSESNLVGFVRVLTDYVYKATIYDLIVRIDWRGRNLGRTLVDAIMVHPDLKEVEHFDLHCLPEMYKFYEKWGFTSDLGRVTLMRRINRGG